MDGRTVYCTSDLHWQCRTFSENRNFSHTKPYFPADGRKAIRSVRPPPAALMHPDESFHADDASTQWWGGSNSIKSSQQQQQQQQPHLNDGLNLFWATSDSHSSQVRMAAATGEDNCSDIRMTCVLPIRQNQGAVYTLCLKKRPTLSLAVTLSCLHQYA